jgi:hypothetical protein
MPETRDLTVAQTILAQLGGHEFLAMTGARTLVGSPDALSFRLPATRGANAIRIVLNAMDTYTVTLARVHGTRRTIISEHEGIYSDQLRGLIERETGLATSLTRSFA